MNVKSAAFKIKSFFDLSYIDIFLIKLLTLADLANQLFYLVFSNLTSIFMELCKITKHTIYSGTSGALTIITLLISKTLNVTLAIDTSLCHNRVYQMCFICFNFGRVIFNQVLPYIFKLHFIVFNSVQQNDLFSC